MSNRLFKCTDKFNWKNPYPLGAQSWTRRVCRPTPASSTTPGSLPLAISSWGSPSDVLAVHQPPTYQRSGQAHRRRGSHRRGSSRCHAQWQNERPRVASQDGGGRAGGGGSGGGGAGGHAGRTRRVVVAADGGGRTAGRQQSRFGGGAGCVPLCPIPFFFWSGRRAVPRVSSDPPFTNATRRNGHQTCRWASF